MYQARIEAADPKLLDGVATQCGELAIGCTEAAGQVHSVAASIAAQSKVLGELQAVMASLETDQRQVTDATDEARMLSENARMRLKEGADIIAASIAEFGDLTKMVMRLGSQITNFASAMDQVRRTTQTIDGIARTTNMLALNAAIEAEKAGDAGRTFAVVAAEVKKLAQNTRAATEEIGATMDSLTSEGDAFVLEIQNSMVRSREAESGFARINETVAEVIGLVDQVDRQADDIARSTSLIHDSVCRVGDELDGFANAAGSNGQRLSGALGEMKALELQASAMFDTFVHSGFLPDDRRFVDIALAERDRFLTTITAGLADGTLDVASLFDDNYRPIVGSNPERFDSKLNGFADRVWRPMLDTLVKIDPLFISAACTDRNGYLPTHTTKYSRTPTGDPARDAAHCRNRRILLDETDRIAKASEKSFHLSVYRRENDDGGFHVVRNVYVPMIVNGRRWGDFELAYRVD
jgi:methyl-accepting chemotaxis protein